MKFAAALFLLYQIKTVAGIPISSDEVFHRNRKRFETAQAVPIAAALAFCAACAGGSAIVYGAKKTAASAAAALKAANEK
jgi:hypothetical protein